MHNDYDDYLDDELDDYLDDELDDELDNLLLDDLDDEAERIRDDYEMQLEEIDEYWDRENEYIKSSGIYTPEEVEEIVENHNRIRQEKKEEVREEYEVDKEHLKWKREQAAYDRKMHREERVYERPHREPPKPKQPVYSYRPQPKEPSIAKRAFTMAAIYHFLKKLF